jgi:hypothetical protein
MKLESKEEMRRRGLASPDEADALCVALSGCPKSFNIAGTPEWNEGWVQQLAEEIGSGQLPGASFG